MAKKETETHDGGGTVQQTASISLTGKLAKAFLRGDSVTIRLDPDTNHLEAWSAVVTPRMGNVSVIGSSPSSSDHSDQPSPPQEKAKRKETGESLQPDQISVTQLKGPPDDKQTAKSAKKSKGGNEGPAKAPKKPKTPMVTHEDGLIARLKRMDYFNEEEGLEWSLSSLKNTYRSLHEAVTGNTKMFKEFVKHNEVRGYTEAYSNYQAMILNEAISNRLEELDGEDALLTEGTSPRRSPSPAKAEEEQEEKLQTESKEKERGEVLTTPEVAGKSSGQSPGQTETVATGKKSLDDHRKDFLDEYGYELKKPPNRAASKPGSLTHQRK
jgi:hypothetical protein